ncbi:5-oxoprolinase subunit B/C family protein [Rothia kristinae]
MPQPPADAAPALHALGPRAVLADLADLAAVLDLRERVLADPPEHLLPGRAGTVPAARTLLLRFDRSLDGAARTRLARHLGRLTALDPGAQAPADRERVVEIPVRYDGADLAACAEHLGCTPEEVVRRHTETSWRAGFAGFAPGFAYLTPDGGPACAPDGTGPVGLEVPRRDSPRTRVPAGSVALAGTFSAVYPQDSPGGWQLIGRTDAPLWEVDRDPPALIAPGDVVRFRAIADGQGDAGWEEPAEACSTGVTGARGATEDSPDGSRRATGRDSGGAAATPEPRDARLRILAPGLSTTLQDAGRPGLDDLGVGPSGWADPLAAHAANRLVGNPMGSAVLENALGRLRVTVPEDAPDAVLALTGARVQASLSGSDAQGSRPAPLDRPFLLRAGQTLEIGPVRCGLRLVLAVRGGFTGRAVLGSLATDTLSGVGPAPLTRGDEVAVGPPPRAAVEPWCPPVPLPSASPEAALRLPLTPGPRRDWFAEDSVAALGRTVWRVAEQSDRVAARLEPDPSDAAGDGDRAPAPGGGSAPDAGGPGTARSGGPGAPEARLRRAPERKGAELASEPLVRGAVQIPPNGHPVVFLADRPVTGGYPVLGLVAPEHLRLLAQAPPGTRVVLEPPASMPAPPAARSADPADPADPPETAAPTEESRCAPS